jgi:glucokinase
VGIVSEVLGVDLGGTKIAVARLDGTELGQSVIKPTDHSSAEALIEQVASMIEDSRSADLDGVGVGVPSVVEFDTGRVVSTVNLPLVDVPLREVLGERLGVPVFVDNDATVAALAEAHDDQMRMAARDLVMLTIGTGVGGGLVLGGRIYRGATGGAGELGHTLVGLDLSGGRVPEPQAFPQPGSLERLAAGRALDRLVEECADTHPDSSLARMRAEGRELLGADAVQAAHDGDPEALAVVARWAERVGVGVANAIGNRTTIRLARHGVRAGVLGAALLAVHELEDAAKRERSAHSPTEIAG